MKEAYRDERDGSTYTFCNLTLLNGIDGSQLIHQSDIFWSAFGAERSIDANLSSRSSKLYSFELPSGTYLTIHIHTEGQD